MPPSRKPRTRASRTQPTWSDLKAKLADFDRAKLLGLVADLYAASRENQTFLHARFDLGEEAVEVYKATISRWVYPDFIKGERVSVATAKKAIADYRKAIGKRRGWPS
jgi:hypothetical protein